MQARSSRFKFNVQDEKRNIICPYSKVRVERVSFFMYSNVCLSTYIICLEPLETVLLLQS